MTNYTAGTDVVLTINAVFNSLAYTADSATFQVYGPGDVLLYGPTVVPSANITSGSIVITIPAAYNALTSPDISEGRVVTIVTTCAAAFAGSQSQTTDYVISTAPQSLVLMTNSFQAYADSIALANVLSGELDNWQSATSDQRIAAMATAFNFLARLNYEIYYDYDDVYFKQRADWGLPYQATVGRLYAYNPDQFLALDPDFISCIRKAQIVEADVRMGSNTLEQLREVGVLTEKVGDDITTFRPGKPIDLMVSKKAMRYLSGYIKYTSWLVRS